MRIFICCALFSICCLAAIPSVNSDRNYKKISEYNERDRRDTRDRYSNRNDNDYKYKRRYRGSNSDDDDTDEDFSISRSDRLRRQRRDDVEDNPPPRARNYKEKVVRRKYEDTDEDYTSEESNEVCVNKRGRHCDSDDVTDETNEDYTDEDSDDKPKKRVIYVKKFPHEKRKQKKDKESGTILKMHKRAGGYVRSDDDDTTSEEIGIPKRRRFILEDEEE